MPIIKNLSLVSSCDFLSLHKELAGNKVTMILLSWQDRDFRWSDVYVTEVIDACHFWAHVGGKAVIEKMEVINKELLSQVCCDLVAARLCLIRGQCYKLNINYLITM